MKRSLAVFASLLLSSSAAFAASAYYTPTASVTALANYGAASPLIAHAFVASRDMTNYNVSSGNFDWVAGNCTPNARTVFAATGVPTSGAGAGCWFASLGTQNYSRISVGTVLPDQNLPGGFAPSLITSINDNGAYTPFAQWSFGATAPIGQEFYKARGIKDAPTAIKFGDPLIDFGGRGYDGVTFQGSNVAIVTSAAEDWDPTHRGTWIQLSNTPIAGTARTKWGELDPAGNWNVTSFVGAGMATLDGIHNQIPDTYFHARGLNQSVNGFVKIQDDFHTGANVVAFQTYYDSANTRIGWSGFNAGTNGGNWVFNNENTLGFQFRSTSGAFLDISQYGVGVNVAPSSGDKFITDGFIRTKADASGFQISNTANTAVMSLVVRGTWEGTANVTDTALAATKSLYLYVNGSATKAGFIDATSKILDMTAGYSANGTVGVSCSGSPSGSFASVLGIVTHC